MKDIIGSTDEELAAEEALAASLSRLAYSVPDKKNRRSRFWFKLDQPAAVPAETMKPKVLEHIDSEIINRLAIYKGTSPAMFQGNIEAVREFFLNEVAPRTIAASGGTIQAAEVLKRLLDTEIDESTAQRFAQMVSRAATLTMGRFVASYFNLPEKYIDSVIGIQSTPLLGGFDLKHVLERVEQLDKSMQSNITKLRNRLDDKR